MAFSETVKKTRAKLQSIIERSTNTDSKELKLKAQKAKRYIWEIDCYLEYIDEQFEKIKVIRKESNFNRMMSMYCSYADEDYMKDGNFVKTISCSAIM